MPYSEKQRRFFLADLERKKKGLKTKAGISMSKLKELAHSPLEKKKKKKKKGLQERD